MNRREFLKAGSNALALGALVPSGLAAPENTPAPTRRKIKKAIMYATVGVKGSVLEKFTAQTFGGWEYG